MATFTKAASNTDSHHISMEALRWPSTKSGKSSKTCQSVAICTLLVLQIFSDVPAAFLHWFHIHVLFPSSVLSSVTASVLTVIPPSLVISTPLCLDFISYFLHNFPFLKVMSICSCDFFITLCNGDVSAALACSYAAGNYCIMYCLCSFTMFLQCPPPLYLGLLPWVFVWLFTVSLGLDFFVGLGFFFLCTMT